MCTNIGTNASVADVRSELTTLPLRTHTPRFPMSPYIPCGDFSLLEAVMAEGASPTASNDHIMGVYNRAPLSFERGRGARLYTEEGVEYLDCLAGIATTGLGHAHPKLVQALKDQGEKLWHVSNVFRIPGQEKLAARLCEVTGMDEVFFGNSGAEAIDCALKT